MSTLVIRVFLLPLLGMILGSVAMMKFVACVCFEKVSVGLRESEQTPIQLSDES
jgi:hypothetical protein